MPVPQQYGRQGSAGPSCFDKVKLGFLMGACVGAGAGVLIGGFSALSSGLRGRELLRMLGKVSISSAGTFGTFMAIGSGLRC